MRNIEDKLWQIKQIVETRGTYHIEKIINIFSIDIRISNYPSSAFCIYVGEHFCIDYDKDRVYYIDYRLNKSSWGNEQYIFESWLKQFNIPNIETLLDHLLVKII